MTALLEVKNIVKRYSMGGVFSHSQMVAVNDVSFTLDQDRPEIFTIIGESGSGKTTVARMILGLEKPDEGEIYFHEKPTKERKSRRAQLEFMAVVQPVFQNPFEAFNPLKQVDRFLSSTAQRFLGLTDEAEIDAVMDEALKKVGLTLEDVKSRYPHELSGGQLQRVAIARALVCSPSLLIADEPVSMIDASLRMSIVNLFKSLRDEFGVSVIYITHDLATAYYISDRIIIMQKGFVVEMGPARPILDHPEHPYSRLLKASVLSVDDAGEGKLEPATELIALAAEVAGKSGQLKPREDLRFVREYSG